MIDKQEELEVDTLLTFEENFSSATDSINKHDAKKALDTIYEENRET
jgi:hypothetical protein